MACPDLAYYTSLDGVNYALLCNHFEMLYNRHYVGGSLPLLPCDQKYRPSADLYILRIQYYRLAICLAGHT